ncbi:hypothetical protein H8959_001649 [Pygathrix nigripes]
MRHSLEDPHIPLLEYEVDDIDEEGRWKDNPEMDRRPYLGQGGSWNLGEAGEIVKETTIFSGCCDLGDLTANTPQIDTAPRRHTLSWQSRPQWKANPQMDPKAVFQREQLIMALYPQTICYYHALIHTPPQQLQDDYSVLFEDTSYADGYSPPLNVAQRYVVACKEPKKK